MMKEMSHLDKKIDNRNSAQRHQNERSIRLSSTNKQNADEILKILSGYLNEQQEEPGEVNKS